jgi:O-antigen/teichoic acid export membrane protein
LSSGSLPVTARGSAARHSDVPDATGQTPGASTGVLLVRGSVLRVLTLVVGIGAGLFLMPFLVHTLGDRWYGMWTLVVSITAYYALLDFGMARAATRFLVRAITLADVAEANSVIVTSLVILAAMGGVTLLASIVTAYGAQWLISDPAEISPFRYVVLILGADAAVLLPALVVNAVFLAHYRFDVMSWVQLGVLALGTALIVYFALQGHGIVTMAFITFGINMVSRAALAVVARCLFRWIELRPALFHLRQVRQLLHYGKHAFLAAGADRIRSNAGIIIVASLLAGC